MRGPGGQLLLALGVLLATIVIGTVGYILLEGWSFSDAIYMTVISVTTTGYREVRELSGAGRALTVAVILFGLASIGYLGGRTVQLLVDRYLVRRGKMDRRISRLRKHVIVCGFGRMGRHLSKELDAESSPFVVVERNQDLVAALESSGYLFVVGDSSENEVLLQAGVERARGLISVVASDAENVFTTLTAKSLNAEIVVATRAVSEQSEPKLKAAGADRVIKPYELVGRRLAQLVLRPGIVEFIDTIARTQGKDITLEEVVIEEGSPLDGQSLIDSPIRRDLNIIVIAIRRAGGDFVYNPASTVVLSPDDRLMAVGERRRLEELSSLCSVNR